MTNLPPKSPAFSRRDTLKTLGAGAIGAAAAAHPLTAFAQTPARKPNFLFIMADDLGYADLSCYGRREYRTPVLDRLATQGIRLTSAYANSAICSPTRLALITGRYQYRIPAGLVEPLGGTGHGLDPAHPTLPSLLKAQGYHTALIGKWHMGSLPDYGPLKSGYDEFWGNRGGAVDYFSHGFGRGSDLWDGDVQIEESGYYTDMLAQRSLQFLDARAKADKPWLLSLHFTAPHWPWEGPGDKAESDRIAGKIVHYDGGSLATYAEMVTALDAAIGRVLARLSELGLDEETVVVFTSDNGGERFSDNWPFTGMKSELLEGGLRVPLIVRWPGVTVAGSTSDVPAISMDFLPTFLAAAGGAPDPAYPSDGVDLRPVLAGATPSDRPLFWRFGRRNQKALRLGRYKYLSIDGNDFLFDVVTDPLERANLKERQPAIFAEFQARFEAWNATMLTDATARSYGFEPDQLADHFGPVQPR